MAVATAEILDAISNMTVLELSQLIKEMEDKFGVSAAAATVAAAPAAAVAAAADTPNFSSISLISCDNSSTVMFEIASRISAVATAMSIS